MDFAWLTQIAREWFEINREYLDGAMRMPSFRSSGSSSELGAWHREPRLIEISAAHVSAAPWVEVLATLRHEMAHQYVDEVMGVHDEVPHGPAFRRACRLLRVEPDASGALAGSADPGADRVRRLVEKLLALGGSPNENEAAAAMRKARTLMFDHEVDAVQRDVERHYVVRTVGRVRRRHDAWELLLGGLLAEFFFVETIWAGDYDAALDVEGKSLHVYGTPANVAMAEYVHGYLTHVMDELWQTWARTSTRPLGARARLQYLHGVLLGFRQKLREQERERVAASAATGSTALVWRGDPRLVAFYRWHNPRVRTIGRRAVELTEARVAGREAGRKVTIHRPLEGGSSQVGGLLGD